MKRSYFAVVASLTVAVLTSLMPAKATVPTTFAFAPNVRPACQSDNSSACGRNIEPALVADGDGNLYLSAILGVPGGVNMWKRPAGESHLKYLGQPDGLEPLTTTGGVAAGGGDVDLAVATARNSHGKFNVYAASLTAASVTFLRSEDGGNTWASNLISTAPLFVVDRQWLIADGANDVWLVFRDDAPMWYVRLSHDGGDTFSAPYPLIAPELAATAANPLGMSSRTGNLAIDRTTKDVYVAFANAATPDETVRGGQDPSGKDPTGTVPKQGISRHVVYLARWHDGQPTGIDSIVYSGPVTERVDAIFPTVGVDSAGTIYVGWSTTKGVFVATSANRGVTFGAPVKVSQAPVASTIQPWIVAGDAGRAAIAYLGTAASGLENLTAEWHSYVALSTNADSASPVWTQAEASDHVTHTGAVCLRGLQCDIDSLTGTRPAAQTDRSLAEVTALAIDADGMLVTSWPDNGGGAVPYPIVSKQSGGPAMIGAPSSVLPLEPDPGPGTFTAGSDVTWFFHGAGNALPATTPDGSSLNAPFIQAALSTAVPAGPSQVGIVGYGTTYTPGVSRPAVFESSALATPTGVGGAPTVKLWLQGESGAIGTGVVDYRLLEVPASGPARVLASRSIAGTATDNCCRYKPGPTAPVEITVSYPSITPALVAAGSKLRLELRFTAVVHSATRLFFDNSSMPSAVTLKTGTFS